MIYVDASCLVKMFVPEVDSAEVLRAIQGERGVVVSSLTELETLIQLKGGFLGGHYTRARWRALEAQFASARNRSPFEFRTLPATVFQTALRQHRNSGTIHCRSLDRLHLAAMEELKVTRLMTHDDAQARAATAMGFEVTKPGRR